MSTTGMGRSTARRMLTGPGLPEPAEQVDGRRLRARGFSDDARALLEHVWALMGMPCGKYLVVMLELWLPLVAAAGDLDKPFATEAAVAELKAMSAATVDRYLKPARERMRIKGISTTKPSPLLRNSITIHTCSDEAPKVPGVIEADTVAHCGPSLIGEFARTLTMTDLVTGWTENASIRNNAAKWILEGIKECQQRFPFPMTVFDSDCGGEFINHDVAGWLQARDIAQTRSRPYQKNDQAHVESKNNHVVRKHAFYWRYDTGEELELLNRLWPLVSLRCNFFTPTKKPVGYTNRPPDTATAVRVGLTRAHRSVRAAGAHQPPNHRPLDPGLAGRRVRRAGAQPTPVHTAYPGRGAGAGGGAAAGKPAAHGGGNPADPAYPVGLGAR
ncbi:hypothetical protein AN99_02630 [Mycobacterium tuberculosis M1410]|nr:hypothetical protein AN99_02630 [Mycobacterium tuberculosis M1410]KBB62219.1 hypothetical protein AO55_02287 [Mycobacterium tuberculosis M1948]